MLGTLTIGQAPRADITPILAQHLPTGIDILHAGVLDGLSPVEIAQRFAPQQGEAELISRLVDGTAVRLGKGPMRAALQAKLTELENRGCTQILLLCTGKFDGLTTQKAWLIEPDHILPPAVAALMADRQLGVVVPLASQAASESDKFRVLRKQPLFAVASPYAHETVSLERAAIQLRDSGANAILLDCMGFTESHREIACKASGLPVILSNALIAKLFAELAS